MSTRIEVTKAMVERGLAAVIDASYLNVYMQMKSALEAALNPPMVCKKCGKPKNEHKPICDSRFTDGDKYGCAAICPGYVWEASE